MIVLLDTDILIEFSRGRNAALMTRWQDLTRIDSAILYSPVTAAEVWAGALPKEFAATGNLLKALQCVPATYEVGELAGSFMRRFSKSHALEVPDAMIAASAVLYQAQLWTRNRKHYPMKEITFF